MSGVLCGNGKKKTSTGYTSSTGIDIPHGDSTLSYFLVSGDNELKDGYGDNVSSLSYFHNTIPIKKLIEFVDLLPGMIEEIKERMMESKTEVEKAINDIKEITNNFA